jgi:hypothetical protein
MWFLHIADDNKQRAYEQKQHANTQAATVDNPIIGIRTRLFWTSGRRLSRRARIIQFQEILKLKLN